MQKLKIAVFFLAILLLLIVMFPAVSYAEVEVIKTIPQMIDELAPRFGQDPELIKKIVWCESGFKVQSHDGGRAVNITGIHDTTFKGWLPLYEKEQGETLDIESSYDQLKMMSWGFKKGYQRQWSSYVAYMNEGVYSFHSSLLKKDFVVRCK